MTSSDMGQEQSKPAEKPGPKFTGSLQQIQELIGSHGMDREFPKPDDHGAKSEEEPEVQLYHGAEADLHRHMNSCQKNPGHKKFIPVGDFTMSHLPLQYQDDTLLELIKDLAELTVRVAVHCTSPNRPPFYYHKDQRYPFSNMNYDCKRVGTGRIVSVQFMQMPCRCRECKQSQTPKLSWGMVKVATAVHVVFDVLEAEKTTCQIGYDDDRSGAKATLDGFCLGDKMEDIESDKCDLMCASHDISLLLQLHEKIIKFEDLTVTVNNRFSGQNDSQKLCLIVSHPHGCSKQVSVGAWTSKTDTSTGPSYVYNTSTCPGSSGAHVYTLDWAFYLKSNVVHTGCINKTENVSGVGWKFPPQ